MHSIRHTKATYLAAFLLGALIALLMIQPLRAADAPRIAPSAAAAS